MIYYQKGKLRDGEVGQDISQPAFRTGYGFFETICWNGKKVCHLDAHLRRAGLSLAEFGITEEVINYEKVVLEVVRANRLTNDFARVNIFYPVEKGRTSPIICAVPFEYIQGREWRLYPAPDVFLSSLMKHKTMNRMSYLNVWQSALDNGYNDAVLTDFEGNILESSFASLLFRKGDVFYEPQTPYKLPGTAQSIAAEHIRIEEMEIKIGVISEFENVYALNSLGGMIPVTEIGDVKFTADHNVSDKISRFILELDS